jgi:D-serine deaminase-like pyridoxal phosphate-dependent protein
MGDEHGAVIGAAPLPALGERVALVPGHCDPTVNLYDRYAWSTAAMWWSSGR